MSKTLEKKKDDNWTVAVHGSDNKWVYNTDASINDAMIRMQLLNARKSRHITQKELSKMSGLSESCISNIENIDGKSSPTLRSLVRYAVALDIDIDINFKDRSGKGGFITS